MSYPAPSGRVCDLPNGASVYVVVYDTQQHRIAAYDDGQTNKNLCAIAPVESLPHEAWPAGVVSRLQQWLGLSAAGPARGAGEA